VIRLTRITEQVAAYFPYTEVRPYQDDFIATISEAIQDSRSVLVEGSNGLGKTVAALSACLSVAIERKLKILYVARTHRQHDRVIEELKAISGRQPVSGISIRGRHEVCLNHVVTRYAVDVRAFMEICELLKAKNRCPYYRSIQEKEDEYSLLQRQITSEPYKASEIQRICRKRGFCPYELVKSVLSDVNVIALSYLYVFDPVIRHVFMKNLETCLDKVILVVDEAHNLPETAIDIASSRLTLFAVRQAEAEARRFKHDDIAIFADTVRNEIESTAAKMGKESLVPSDFMTELVKEKAGIDEPLTFFEHLSGTGNAIRRSLLAEGKNPRSYIHGMSEFLTRWMETAEDESFVKVISKYTSKRGVPTAKLEIVALDPSKITEPVFSSVYSNVVMSGTLQPLEAYLKITRLPDNTIQCVVPSPFPREHVLPLISCGVTTAMERRTPEMYAKIIDRIAEIVRNTPANTGVFAASFEVLSALLAAGLKDSVNKPVFNERRGMSSKENEKMVAEFKSHADGDGAVLLGVQGGRSSEGVDFPGNQMNSVAVVGIPYAEPTPKVKAQIGYFEKCFPGMGREYGYVLPAMKKASQAAGRPIRTLEDMGAMIFLDHRFATLYCQSFLPLWIRENLKVLPDEAGTIAHELSCFFRRVS
jgi:DNA excision repair protein ERCC-2